MQAAGNRPETHVKETLERNSPDIDLSQANEAVARALEERLASGRPMSRSLRRAYEQLMAREPEGRRRSEIADPER